jgi:gamma-glutamylcyclotransferase
VWYFAYGSNMSRHQMGQRCPGHGRGLRARVDGFRLAFDRYSKGRGGGHVADILPEPSSHVWGVLWEVEERHLDVLDGFEGVARGVYRRVDVEAEMEDASAVAIAYQICEPAEEGAPSRDYLDLLLEGAREFDFPSGYVRFLRLQRDD